MQSSAEIDLGFMRFVTDLLLCSRCLRRGIRTRVRQPISPRHRPVALCRGCRGAHEARRTPAGVDTMRREG